jgi:hypothetical protein
MVADLELIAISEGQGNGVGVQGKVKANAGASIRCAAGERAGWASSYPTLATEFQEAGSLRLRSGQAFGFAQEGHGSWLRSGVTPGWVHLWA